jgi:hypothetical protein
MDWMNLAQDRDQLKTCVNTVRNLWVPQNVQNFLASRVTSSFSGAGPCSKQWVFNIIHITLKALNIHTRFPGVSTFCSQTSWNYVLSSGHTLWMKQILQFSCTASMNYCCGEEEANLKQKLLPNFTFFIIWPI